MKEVKAYVRVDVAPDVVGALEEGGFCSLTIIDVSALGRLADPTQRRWSMEFVEKYSTMVRIELVCKDSDADKAVTIIRECGCTHQAGDGIIFVLPVESAVKIRTGEGGDQILQGPSLKRGKK
jgi:nitrogen regulatory protein P-II 1